MVDQVKAPISPVREARAEQEAILTKVLADEYRALHGDPPPGSKLDTLEGIYSAIHRLREGDDPQPRTAICLSGGGIRSASFALGVLQAFADKNLLDRFHFLSTVSGGGYIGGWLSAWRKRADNDAEVMKNLNRRLGGVGREPSELRGLRANSNYLTPKLGVLSADTWAIVALYIRNLLLNWLIFLPMIIGLVLVPIIARSTLEGAIDWSRHIHHGFLFAAGALLLLGLFTSIRGRIGAKRAGRVTQAKFLVLELLPTYVAALLICLYAVGGYRNDPTQTLFGPFSILRAALVGAGLYGITWIIVAVIYADKEMPRLRMLFAWAFAGSIGGALIGWGCVLAGMLVKPPDQGGIGIEEGTRLLGIFGVGWIAASLFLAESIYLGLTSYSPKGDAEREWLARSSGWFIALTVGWGVLAALVLYAPDIRRMMHNWFWTLPAAGAGAGTIVAGIGSSARTLTSFISGKKGESVPVTTLLSIASLIFIILMIVVLSAVASAILPHVVTYLDKHLPILPISSPDRTALVAIAIIAVCACVVLALSMPINVNRFSSHSLYRNRLARAFLGSARGSDGWAAETRDPFTGFDETDNQRMSELSVPTDRPRLWHVVNMALNVVSGTDNAWQERKAQSFVVTPKVAGNEYVGFCDTRKFGADDGRGISLGTCMAISGAAASPNQGYHSSPLIGFIMTLFNVRLGWWLGNPRYPDKAKRQGPIWGIFQIVKEFFGQTDDKSSYVYLSDGGHFENLGLYEMVRRRCHMIVVSDGGCDPDCAFEDLGNAMRKIWIDLGVRLEFKKIEIRKRGLEKEALYCALGRIHYPELEEKDAGYILYLKPGFHDNGTEPPDVCAYALANLTFPHETTADQFFSESQMESYRSLGRFIADTVLGKPEVICDTTAPTVALQPYWAHLSKYIAQFDRQKAAEERN